MNPVEWRKGKPDRDVLSFSQFVWRKYNLLKKYCPTLWSLLKPIGNKSIVNTDSDERRTFDLYFDYLGQGLSRRIEFSDYYGELMPSARKEKNLYQRLILVFVTHFYNYRGNMTGNNLAEVFEIYGDANEQYASAVEAFEKLSKIYGGEENIECG